MIVDYAGVVRWTVGTFMKPHIDPHRPDQEPDLFADVLYLNDDYTGGHTGFEESEIKPETGKLLVFSNSIYKHHVTKIEEQRDSLLTYGIIENEEITLC